MREEGVENEEDDMETEGEEDMDVKDVSDDDSDIVIESENIKEKRGKNIL